MRYKIIIVIFLMAIGLVSCKNEVPLESDLEDFATIEDDQLNPLEETPNPSSEADMKLSVLITQLNEALKQEDLTVEKKRSLETEISGLIYYGYGFDDRIERVFNYYPTPITKEAIGYAVIGDDQHIWCELAQHTVIEITSQVSLDWYTARRIMQQPIAELSDFYLESDRVEFLIHRDNLAITDNIEPINYGPCSPLYASEYQYIIEDDGPKTPNGFLNEAAISDVYIYEEPDEQSKIISFALEGDVVRKHKDTTNHTIEYEDWVYIETIPFYWTESRSGWVKKSQVRLIEADDIPNSGFVRLGAILYNGPSEESGVFDGYGKDSGLNIYNDVILSCVAIHSREGDWYVVSDGLNGAYSGFLKAEDILFILDDEMMLSIYNPTFDPKLFINQVMFQIQSNPEFRLEAKDMGVSVDLTKEQRDLLAESFTWIDKDLVFHDGGVSGDREASYPYYCLNFGTSNLVVTVNDTLLLNLDAAEAYEFGAGTEGIPLRFLTPNAEFIDAIEALLPPDLNDNPEEFLFLLNASSLKLGSEAMGFEEANLPEQINKVVRGLQGHMGDVLDTSFQPRANEEQYHYLFEFEDGTTREVIHTETYIFYNDLYYQAKVVPSNFYSGLFAAYF